MNTDAVFLQGGGEAGALIRSIDWEATSLGAPETWPMNLKVVIRSMLTTPVPTYICWGVDYIQFYNDAYIPTFGSKHHPFAMGKTLKDVSLTWMNIEAVFSKIMLGESIRLNDMKIPVDKNGYIEECYMDMYYTPIYKDDWSIGGIHAVVFETTQKVKALTQSKEDAWKIRSMIDEATVGFCLFVGDNMLIEMANDLIIQIWGKDTHVIGQELEVAIPELKGQPFLSLLQTVLKTGESYTGKSAPAQLVVNGVLRTFYFDFTYKAMRDLQGKIYGIVNMVVDVTEKVLATQKLEQSQKELLVYFEQSPVAVAVINKEKHTFRLVNEFYGQLVGRKPEELENKPLLEAMPELKGKGFDDLIEGVISTGVPYVANEYFVEVLKNGILESIYVNFTYQAQRDNNGGITGVLVVATDVTPQVLARKKVEESELFSHSVIYNSPVAKLVFTGEEMKVSIVNENMLQILGRDNSILGKTFIEAIPELKDSPLIERMKNVFLTGETYIQPEERLDLIRFGEPYSGYYTYTYKALRQVSGEIYGIIVAANEITEQVIARKIIEAKEKELRDLISAAPIGICVVAGNPVWAKEVNDRFLIISGKTREQYANEPYWQVLSEVAHIFEPILKSVFETGEKFTSEENQMVLVRDGIEENIFLNFEYIPIFDLNRVVSKVIIMAIEVTHQVETRKEIEAAVAQRTKELAELNISLKRSNAELEQFAYIASHDLQEPIRKISTFTQMLERSMDNMNEKSKNYISKIYSSTDRMTKLIRDVLAFSQISQNTDKFEDVDLTQIVHSMEEYFDLLIEQKEATIEIVDLPIIQAIPSQMAQLFDNLMSNSLKYTRAGVKPHIKISCTAATKEMISHHPQLFVHKKYYHIEFRDNGIGFDQEHADRIFKIFQRLHAKTEYEGTGIGLSICRKIVQSHMGHIAAMRGDDGGAVFSILLPK